MIPIIFGKADSDELTDLADWCRDVDVISALILLHGIVEEMKKGPDKIPDSLSKYFDFDVAFALCILVTIDIAAWCVVSGNMGGFSSSFGFTKDLSMFIQNAEMLKEQASDRAKKAAFARHKETREMRQDAISYYEENKDTFKSRAAAARFIAGNIVPVIERTVDGWLKQHIDAQSARKL